jgi:hypothetical protein
MNAPIWTAWIVVAIMAALSVILLLGKGSFLIAGYNTASKETKQRYDAKKLCRVVGGGLSVLTVILGISAFYEFELPSAIGWIMPWGFLGTVAVMAILANTICRAKKGGTQS